MATISKADFPYTGPYSKDGNGKHKGNTALALKRAMSRLGYLPWEPEKWDNAFNQKLEDALDRWDPGKNGYAEGRYDKIRSAVIPKNLPNGGKQALDSTCINQVQTEYASMTAFKTPALGPLEKGGASLLDFALSHDTSGIPLYPATDTVWTKGTTVIAPEDLKVTKASSSKPGCAFYAEGVSGCRYWFGHLTSALPVGTTVKKGKKIGVVGAFSGYTPHLHVGFNVEKILGKGKEFKHGNNYSVSGIPTIRKQFEAL
jgi:murein DD-endopeptidase MepM/ murein hydrolase activator NlpD